ncbi:MAG: GNAT family N-acetyltransferase [Rhizobiaceae bacterium]
MSITLRPNPDFPLPHGVSLQILGRPDRELFVEHLLHLDATARHDRFNGGINDEALADYADRCLSPGVLVIAAMQDGKVIGVAELHPVKPQTAEVAFSVSDGQRGRGIGAALFALILEAAWSRGLWAIEISTHSDNEAMKSLARQFGAELHFSGNDTSGLIHLDQIRFEETAVDAGPRPVRKPKAETAAVK